MRIDDFAKRIGRREASARLTKTAMAMTAGGLAALSIKPAAEDRVTLISKRLALHGNPVDEITVLDVVDQITSAVGSGEADAQTPGGGSCWHGPYETRYSSSCSGGLSCWGWNYCGAYPVQGRIRCGAC